MWGTWGLRFWPALAGPGSARSRWVKDPHFVTRSHMIAEIQPHLLPHLHERLTCRLKLKKSMIVIIAISVTPARHKQQPRRSLINPLPSYLGIALCLTRWSFFCSPVY